MQIEQLASMPKELPPPTTTTVFDAAAASPRIWSLRSLLRAKWRSKGALILYAALGLSLLGYKLFWHGPHRANASAAPTATATTTAGDETRQLMAKLQAASKARNAAKVAEEKAPRGSVTATAAAAAPTAAMPAPRSAVPAPMTSGTAVAKKPAAAPAPAPAASAAAPAAPTTAPVASAKSMTPAAEALGSLYIDETNGFSIRFPAGWVIRTFDGDPWVCDVGDGKVGLMSVGFSPFPEGFTAESIPPDWIAKKIKRRADTTLHAQGYSMISGRKALWSKSTGPLPMSHASPRMTRVNYILPLGDGRVLELRVAAAPEVFDRLVPVMRKSVETFVLQTPRKREREPMASAR
jgi:hypothetical protein